MEQELDNQFSREPTVAGAIYEVVHKEFIKLEAAYWLKKEEEIATPYYSSTFYSMTI